MLKIKFSLFVLLVQCLFSVRICVAELIDFTVINYVNKSVVILDFQGLPVYRFYLMHDPEKLILDISYNVLTDLNKFPLNFSNGGCIQRVGIKKFINKKDIRFIFDLIYISSIDDILLEQINGFYRVLLIVTKHLHFSRIYSLDIKKENGSVLNAHINLPIVQKGKNPFVSYMKERSSKNISTYSVKMFSCPIIVAIDAGHGGHDPGARGCSGVYEKDITIAIAKKLNKLLDQDPMFYPVMIRNGDYFVSVFDRSELARSKGAKVLLSIHADAISSRSKSNVRGASVWVLSNQRATIEMSNWLRNSNKWDKLSGGISNILGSDNADPYFNRAILDLQFSHSQRMGYGIAVRILSELKDIGELHKDVPEYSNFGILRSLDIPSILIETGFITNAGEEKLLISGYYQEKIAAALYKGLRSYFLKYFVCFEKKDHKLFF